MTRQALIGVLLQGQQKYERENEKGIKEHISNVFFERNLIRKVKAWMKEIVL